MSRIPPQAVLGILIIATGLLLTGDNLGWYDADQVWRFWPLGLVLFGLVKVLQDSAGRVVGAIIMVVGAILTAETAFGLPGIENYWPLGLIALGLVILVRTIRPAPPAATPTEITAASVTHEESISEVAVWAGKQRRVASPVLRRGDLTAVMGGVEVDLRHAATATGEAVIDVFVMWGGVEIWVPPDWAVINKVGVLMGGVEDKSTGMQDARHRLIVRGFVVMGGLDIKT